MGVNFDDQSDLIIVEAYQAAHRVSPQGVNEVHDKFRMQRGSGDVFDPCNRLTWSEGALVRAQCSHGVVGVGDRCHIHQR